MELVKCMLDNYIYFRFHLFFTVPTTKQNYSAG